MWPVFIPSFKFLKFVHDAFKRKESNVLRSEPSGSGMIDDFFKKKVVLHAKYIRVRYFGQLQKKKKSNGVTISL